MDIITYALCKKLASGAVSGISNFSVSGLTLTMTTNSGQTLTMNFPSPAPIDVDIDSDNYLIFTMQDGTTLKSTNPIAGLDISKEQGNTLMKKADGLYVPTGNVQISKLPNNAIETKTDGLFVAFSSSDINFAQAVNDTVNNNKETEDIDFSDW